MPGFDGSFWDELATYVESLTAGPDEWRTTDALECLLEGQGSELLCVPLGRSAPLIRVTMCQAIDLLASGGQGGRWSGGVVEVMHTLRTLETELGSSPSYGQLAVLVADRARSLATHGPRVRSPHP